MRGKLTKWKEVLSDLESPKLRPNDYQRLILNCLNNGLTIRDAQRVFGVSESMLQDLRAKYPEQFGPTDKRYFMDRARQLGADDEAIAIWFGIDRADKVSMILAGHKD